MTLCCYQNIKDLVFIFTGLPAVFLTENFKQEMSPYHHRKQEGKTVK